MKKEKEKITFKDEDEKSLYIMYYAAYMSKLRGIRNEADNNRVNRKSFYRNTTLAACIETAKRYVDWH